MFCYIGLVFGDIFSGTLSQFLNHVRRFYIFSSSATLACICIYLFLNSTSTFYFYSVCILMGTAVGYWVIFVTNSSEQFGTNLRSTVTTTVPNFIRGSVIPLNTFISDIETVNGNKVQRFCNRSS
jgi:putative MFS transporter